MKRKSGTWSAIPNWDQWRASAGEIEPKVLWPEQRSLAFIMEQKEPMGDLAFAQEYLCKVMDDDSAKDIQGRTLERTWTLILNRHTLRIMAVGM